MLKFFRKIRQNLLNEGNVSKYLKYAFGEVILVVIGILVALSINNRNDQQIEIRNLKGNFKYLIEDLEKNKEQLMQLKQERLEVTQFCTEFIESYIHSKPITSDTPIENFRRIILEINFENNQSGFERVKSSKIFESNNFEGIRKKISEYEKIVKYIVLQENNQNSFTEEMEAELFKNGIYSKLFPYMRADYYKGKYKYPIQKLDFQKIIKNSYVIQGIFGRYEFAMPWLTTIYDDLVLKGEELKLEIEKYLAQN